MEFGSSHEEMVFDDFDETYQWISHMVHRAQERKILTATEQSRLKRLKNKLPSFSSVEQAKIESLKRKLKYLLKYYSTYYNS